MTDRLESLRDSLKSFNKERDWEPYHNPRNLAAALVVEAAEVLEIYRWLDDGQATDLAGDRLEHLRQEIGDVMICLTNLAESYDLDILDCAKDKLELNAKKYPAG